MRSLFCVLLLTVCSACSDTVESDGDPWAFGADVMQNSVTRDAGSRSDSVAAPRSCEPGVLIDSGEVLNGLTRPIVIADDSWFFLRTGEDGSHDLWRQFELDQEPVLLRENVTSLVDAGERGVLILNAGSVVLYDPRSGEDLLLGPADSFSEVQRAPFASAAYRFIDEDIISWPQNGIWVATDAGSAQLGVLAGSLPYVRNGAVAYGSDVRGAPSSLTVWSNARAYDFSEGGATNVALSNTHLWFVRSGSSLFQVPVDGLATAQAVPVSPEDEASCHGLAVSEGGETVAASCVVGSDGLAWGIFTSADGMSWTSTAGLNADPLHTFAVDGDWLVYADWANAPPMLVAVPTREPQTAFQLAPVGQGCLSCGAYWPPNYVEVEGGKVAWNYAAGEHVMGGQRTRVGMAELCP